MGRVLDHVHWFLQGQRFKREEATFSREIVAELTDDLDQVVRLLESDEKPERILDNLCKLFRLSRRRSS